jgi:hypothetical protein
MDISSKSERCEIIGRRKWNTPKEIKFASGYQEVNSIRYARIKGGAVKTTQGANNTDKLQVQYWELHRKTELERFLRQLQQPSTGNKPVLVARLLTLNAKCKNIRPSARPHQQSN